MKVVYLLFHKDGKRPSVVSFTANGMKRHITKMIRTGSINPERCTVNFERVSPILEEAQNN